MEDPEYVQEQARQYVSALVPYRYDVAYNLNQHGRAIVAAHLCAERVRGPGVDGALSAALPPWAAYLRTVAGARGANRVHLADAFCGTCGVRPPGTPPQLSASHAELPHDLAAIGERDGVWVAVVVGAGDAERVIPADVWRQWIAAFLDAVPTGQIVLVGTGPERTAALAIQDRLSALHQARLWDTTGRLSLSQLPACLQRCRWVIGADTGPLHLGAALGLRTMGWFLARARAHETGPYGAGHWVWQAELPATGFAALWPIASSLTVLLTDSWAAPVPGWTLWRSGFDEWGTFYCAGDDDMSGRHQRAQVWHAIESTGVGSAA